MKKILTYAMTLCVGFSLALLCVNAEAISARIAYNTSNYSIFNGIPQIQSGESYVAANGQEVPFSILYTDEAGGISNFLSVSQIAELLDADVKWDSRTNTVDFGTATTPAPDTENTPFTELVWSERIERSENAWSHLKEAHFQSESAFSQTFQCRPDLGEYVLVQVTNQGEKPVSLAVSRVKTIGQRQDFPTDVVRPGETLCRVFSVDKSGNELTTNLNVTVRSVQGADSATLDIVVDVSQEDGIGDDLEVRSMVPPVLENFEGLSMEVTSQEAGAVTVRIDNHSDRDFSCGGGDDYVLEKEKNGSWEEVTQGDGSYAILPVAHNICAGNSESMTFQYQSRYGTLENGTYRILKPFMEIGAQQNCCYLTAEFEID